MLDILLGQHEDEHFCWKARAVVMSDLLEIFKHEQMVILFRVFFEKANLDGNFAKFQMHFPEVELPSYSDQEQNYIPYDGKNLLLDER